MSRSLALAATLALFVFSAGVVYSCISITTQERNQLSEQITCRDHLRVLALAKEHWMRNYSTINFTSLSMTDLIQTRCLSSELRCPAGGAYNLGAREQMPFCSLSARGHAYTWPPEKGEPSAALK
jgi:hypothetical protein